LRRQSTESWLPRLDEDNDGEEESAMKMGTARMSPEAQCESNAQPAITKDAPRHTVKKDVTPSGSQSPLELKPTRNVFGYRPGVSSTLDNLWKQL
jgi:hypothetical protein